MDGRRRWRLGRIRTQVILLTVGGPAERVKAYGRVTGARGRLVVGAVPAACAMLAAGWNKQQ